MADLYIRTFIFSREQMEQKKQIESKIKTKVDFGKVLVNGTYKMFTDIVTDVSECKYSDAVVLITGDIRKIRYIEPTT